MLQYHLIVNRPPWSMLILDIFPFTMKLITYYCISQTIFQSIIIDLNLLNVELSI